jgi:hypothetical protein
MILGDGKSVREESSPVTGLPLEWRSITNEGIGFK